MRCTTNGCGKSFKAGSSMEAHKRWHGRWQKKGVEIDVSNLAKPWQDIAAVSYETTLSALERRRDVLTVELEETNFALTAVARLATNGKEIK